MSADKARADSLDIARASLTECGQHTADDCGHAGPCRRPKAHPGFCDPVEPLSPHRDHLRAALARVDELTAEVERLRLAGVTATRGTECHITRGRDV